MRKLLAFTLLLFSDQINSDIVIAFLQENIVNISLL